MSDTIEIRLVPVNDEDVDTLKNADSLIGNLAALLNYPEHLEPTRAGLYRLRQRIQQMGDHYTIPMPRDLRDPKNNLFVGDADD